MLERARALFRLHCLALALTRALRQISPRHAPRAAQGTFLPHVFEALGTLPVVGPCLRLRPVARLVDLVSGRKPRPRPPV